MMPESFLVSEFLCDFLRELFGKNEGKKVSLLGFFISNIIAKLFI